VAAVLGPCLVTTAHAPTPPDDGVVRIVKGEELDAHPSPANGLQTWLDAPHAHRLDASFDIERASLSSRR
jgi:hypothetical protein